MAWLICDRVGNVFNPYGGNLQLFTARCVLTPECVAVDWVQFSWPYCNTISARHLRGWVWTRNTTVYVYVQLIIHIFSAEAHIEDTLKDTFTRTQNLASEWSVSLVLRLYQALLEG